MENLLLPSHGPEEGLQATAASQSFPSPELWVLGCSCPLGPLGRIVAEPLPLPSFHSWVPRGWQPLSREPQLCLQVAL